MSQVIVTEDHLKAARAKSREQELAIDRDGDLARWRKSDITGKDRLASLVGYLVLPILGFWAALAAIIVLMLGILEFLFKGLARIVGGKRPLLGDGGTSSPSSAK